MGGLLILIPWIGSTLLWAQLSNRYVWIVLMVTVGYGLLGFLDDYYKVTKRTADGLSGRARLAIEFGIAFLATWLIMRSETPALSGALAIPFPQDRAVAAGPVLHLVGGFVITGAANAVNFTDGLDGLAIVPVMIAAATFTLIVYLVGNERFAAYLQLPYIVSSGELAVFLAALVGAGLGFLWYNAPPAAIFMGDTGSLPLGGALGAVAVCVKHEIVLAHRRRLVCAGDRVGHCAGGQFQAHRQARLPHGADPSSLRTTGLDRAHHRDPVLDRGGGAGAGSALPP